LFLDLFLVECDLQTFFKSTEACAVYKEYQYIDLYITDGNKHIIIENKIYASDQELQIQRYIETIKSENKDDPDLSNNVVVIYLSLDRDKPSKTSLGNFNIKDNFIIKEGEKYPFLAITYDVQILSWIEKSKEQVSNITNLSVGISQYKDVILKLYGRYKEKIMSLNEYISNSKDAKASYKILKKISTEYQVLRKEMMDDFLSKTIKALNDKFIGNEDWDVVLSDNDALFLGKRYGFPLRIQQKNDPKVLFGFEFNKNNYTDPSWGIVRRSSNVDFKELNNKEKVKSELQKVHSSLDKSGAWWLRWGYYFKGDLYDKIIDEENIDAAVKLFVEEFLTVFESCKPVIVECNLN